MERHTRFQQSHIVGFFFFKSLNVGRFQWHGLPFEDLSHEDEKVPQNLKSGITYRQSELQEVEGKEGQSAGHW